MDQRSPSKHSGLFRALFRYPRLRNSLKKNILFYFSERDKTNEW